MDDDQFIGQLNRLSSQYKLRLPVISPSESPSSEAVSTWASFLEQCVRNGVELSDPRWERLTVEKVKPVTVFKLQGAAESEPDTDFRVGLQLLMGMFSDPDNSDNPADK